MRSHGRRGSARTGWTGLAMAAALGVTVVACDTADDVDGEAGEGPEMDGAAEAYDRATDLVRSARQDEAIDVALEAIERYPEDAELRKRLGYALRYAGMFDESVDSYQRAISLDDTLPRRVSDEGQIAKSLIYKGAYEEALEVQTGLYDYLDELGEEPDEKMLFYEGVIHVYRADTARAIELFDAAEAADPESVWTEFGRAYRDALTGDVESLRERARALRDRDVADGERHYRLAQFHALAGEPDEAVERLEVSLDGGFFAYPYVAEDPLLGEEIQEHPGFRDILERVRERHEGVAESVAAAAGR